MFVAPFALALTLAAAQQQPAVAQPAVVRPALQVQPARRAAQRGVLRQKQQQPLIRQRPIQPILPIGLPPGSGTGTTSPVLAAGGPGDENVLKAVKLQTTDQALLDFFRKRTPPAPAREKLDELVKKLSSKEAADRDTAQGELTAVGQAAVPLLRQAANNIDNIEGSARAKLCLQNIEGTAGANLAINAARLLATRKPAGAAEALIGYLPYSEDDTTFLEVEAALVSVAMRDGKPDAAILKALKDKVALRRGTAAAVLCQAGGAANYTAIRPLLKDTRASVRLKAALGLVGAYDSEAIPVLIDLLADLTPRLRQQAEDYLTGLAGEWAVSGPKGNDLMSRRLRRDVWVAWWKNADGAKLLEEFKSRTASDDDHEKIVGLIAKLGDATAETRESASTDLIGMGKKAASLLRRAVNDNHPRISPFAVKCLEAIEKDSPDPLPGAAPRLLGLRKPEGAVETLLAYLPFTESEESTQRIIDILGKIGTTAGKGDEALVKALEDKIAVRRAGAALALCAGKATDNLAAIRKLLKDKDQIVQLRAAQGLASLGEKEAVPTLIGLLKDLPLDQVWEVEDYLSKVAGDKTPSEVVTADAASRTKAVDAWTKWWKDNQKTVELAKLDLGSRELGFFLIVENWNPALGRGRVLEAGADMKPRWEIKDLQWPNDAQVLRGGNVLVIEQQNRVTERTRANKIVWDKYFPSVFHAERLRDGSTFLAQRNQLQIIDKDGKQIFNHFYNINSIITAKRFRDGSIAYVSYSGHYVKLDRTGKQVKTMQLNWFNFSINGADVLPGDRVVVSVGNFNKVIEYNGDGKQTWECEVQYPLIPFRLSNGNTIVASNSNTVITEIDRKGKIVKEYKGFSFRPYRVTKR
jgi:HEAT repeat protein